MTVEKIAYQEPYTAGVYEDDGGWRLKFMHDWKGDAQIMRFCDHEPPISPELDSALWDLTAEIVFSRKADAVRAAKKWLADVRKSQKAAPEKEPDK